MKRREEERFENNAQAESLRVANVPTVEKLNEATCARLEGKARRGSEREGRGDGGGNAARSVGIRSPPPRSTVERLFFELGSRVELWIRKP